MGQKNDTPRTWFARSAAGDATVFVRRFEEAGSAASYDIYGYSGDLASEGTRLGLPEGMPESFASLEEALRHGAIVAGRPVEAFADVTGGRSIELELATALRSCSVGPLHIGMSAEELEAALGMPEGIVSWSRGAASWFYGSVMLHLEKRRLVMLEIDKGVGDFTSLRFTDWFLHPAMTLEELASALDMRRVPYRREMQANLPTLETGERGALRFMFDFHEKEVRTLHAMYWLNW